MSTAPDPPVIAFLSDYGLHDDFVGICHGVIARICPAARVIDLAHGIARHDVRAGAIVLGEAIAFLPVGVHLAVVDPGVGGERRAVALRCADQRAFVGPDNGLLSVAARAAGGVVEAVEISRSQFCLQPVSATFHGRDIFAPVAAALAAGASLSDAGQPLDPDSLVVLELPQARRQDGALVCHVLYVDRFGNVALDAVAQDLANLGLGPGGPATAVLAGGGSHRLRHVRAFADVAAGELLLYEDAQRRLALAVRDGDAATLLGLRTGDELRVRPG